MLNCISMSPVFAQAIPYKRSLLGWAMSEMNSFSTPIGILCGFLIFCGACYLVAAKKRTEAIAAYLVLLPVPVLISVCGVMAGMIQSLAVIASVPNLQISSADIAGGTGGSLVQIFFAILISAPTYIVLAIGLLMRTLQLNPNFTKSATISP